MVSRVDHLSPLIHPTPRFFWGLGLMVLFLIQKNPGLLAVELAGFYILARSAGKKISLGYFLFFNLSIAVFSLLAPRGKVFASLGPWDLTWGALEDGVIRGLGLTGMIFISLFSISEKLRLPGMAGDLMSRVFFYFHNLLRERKTLRRESLWADVDGILDRVFSAKPPAAVPRLGPTTTRGWGLMGLVGVVVGACTFWSLAGGEILPWIGDFLKLLFGPSGKGNL